MKLNGKKTDVDLQQDVLAEMQYEPSVNVADIFILAQGGVVNLNAWSAPGVSAVDNQLIVTRSWDGQAPCPVLAMREEEREFVHD